MKGPLAISLDPTGPYGPIRPQGPKGRQLPQLLQVSQGLKKIVKKLAFNWFSWANCAGFEKFSYDIVKRFAFDIIDLDAINIGFWEWDATQFIQGLILGCITIDQIH